MSISGGADYFPLNEQWTPTVVVLKLDSETSVS